MLIDRGGVKEVSFKQGYLDDLKRFKSIDSMISSPLEKPLEIKTSKPVHPIDFLILDVYREMERLKVSKEIDTAIEQLEEVSEKAQKIFHVMMKEKLDSSALLRMTGLNPKDFDDNLERLKFWLRKIT